MAKINLTIPDDLKDQMADHTNVNWSRVASEAFANTMKKEKIMSLDMTEIENVAARLKAEMMTEYELFEDAGKRWARTDANANQLKAIDAYEDDYYAQTMDEIARAYYDETHIFFWEEVAGDDGINGPSNDAKTAFARGAMHIWSEVKQLL